MNFLTSMLIGSSALIAFVLGAVHLFYTFAGRKLHPSDMAIKTQLEHTSLVITRETTMWAAWLGFNASHSLGALLFGAVYGYLALLHSALLFQSAFLLLLGLATLSGYVFLARRYWFSVPFRGFLLAMVAYVSALLINLS